MLIGSPAAASVQGEGAYRVKTKSWDELLQRACDADENLGEDTKRFIDRYMRPGEKRPPAASVRRTGIARADSRRKAGA
jgi:hypothetical protein